MEKTIYILGAGFSRFANLPLMKDFYFRSKDLYPQLKKIGEQKAFLNVFKYFDEFSKVKNIMNADFYNIEELFSIIEMDAYLNNKKQIYKDIISFLNLVIELSSPQKEDEEGYFTIDSTNNTDIYSYFLMEVYGIEKIDKHYVYNRKPGNKNGIISLNYDLLIEKSINIFNKYNKKIMDPNYISFDFEYGLDEKFIKPLYTLKPRFPKLNLAKLHGSLNFHYGDLPIIIPPTWNKTTEKKMKSVWELAYRLLISAEKIVFIGYSLAETDIYIKYLLISGIKESYNLKRVEIICDDKDNSVKNRYYKFFDENFRNKAVEFYSQKFEEWFKKPKPENKIISKQW